MPQHRYYVSEPFYVDKSIAIQDPEFHHLHSVMRQKEGDKLELINGQGQLAHGVIIAIQKKQALVQISHVQEEKPADFCLTLALSFLKNAHLEFAIEKACEIGVSQICLFQALRSEKKELSEQCLKRLQTIVISACKQCGRLYIPTIEVYKNLKECLKKEELSFFGDLSSTSQPIARFAQDLQKRKAATIYIGPESGFTEEEVKRLQENGAHGITLSKNTLRAETAAIVATALFMEWSQP